MIHVDHYGLHRIEGDIALLVQQGRVDHVLGVHLDLQVSVNTRRACTHQIDLGAAAHNPILDQYRDDPLFRAMLPIPKGENEKPLFLEETVKNKLLVHQLAALSSPGSFSILQPFWIARPEAVASWLRETNIQPLVLYGPKLQHAQQLGRVIDAGIFSPRRLIILGSRHTIVGDRVERTEPQVQIEDLKDVNLEAAGAWALRQHMLIKGL